MLTVISLPDNPVAACRIRSINASACSTEEFVRTKANTSPE